jgi:hypothetical protein
MPVCDTTGEVDFKCLLAASGIAVVECDAGGSLAKLLVALAFSSQWKR